MKQLKIHSVPLMLLLILSACRPGASENAKTNITPTTAPVNVDTARAKVTTFHRDLTANGTLRAKRNYQLTSEVAGIVKEVLVTPGQMIKEGDTVALLDNQQYYVSVEENSIKFNKALIELEDILLRYSFALADSASIPRKMWRNACSQSGYDQAMIDIRIAKNNVENLSVRALFSGIVANIGIEPGQQISTGTLICNALFTDELICEFELIEDDYPFIKKGQDVMVRPLALDKKIKATVFAKNPNITENGLFTVYAGVNNPGNKMVNGMNAEVKLSIEDNDLLVVPKEALVVRSDENIVFTYDNGEAVWNFVEILKENSEKVAISRGLEPDDIVITSGNLFLTAKTPVVIKNANSENQADDEKK